MQGSRRTSVVPTSDDDTEDAECVGRDSDHATHHRTDALFPGEPLKRPDREYTTDDVQREPDVPLVALAREEDQVGRTERDQDDERDDWHVECRHVRPPGRLLAPVVDEVQREDVQGEPSEGHPDHHLERIDHETRHGSQ